MTNTIYIVCNSCGHTFHDDPNLPCDECPECGSGELDSYDDFDVERDQFNSDVEADADVLRNAGWGTDEDYGLYSDDGFGEY